MKLAAVRLFVEDLAAARSFYADLLGLQPVSITGPPERRAWGGTLMHVQDPSANIVTFVQD
jgi:catechol 2,3-dioxygenase-like lactoylglutathione lyase family enzyme